ncbi:MAG: hypothetical protein GY798_11810 [Hyphomicrobiales bacterium]|nr:hypothetical protein [Hyphomicrobiales bacterium]
MQWSLSAGGFLEAKRVLVMMIKRILAAAALAAGIGGGTALADDWAGFYVGIDQLDGSLGRVSVVPADADTYSVVIKSSRFGSCESANPAAVMNGSASIAGTQLVLREPTIWCTGVGGSGRVVGDVSFTRDSESRTLSFPAALDGRTLAFQRLSSGRTQVDEWVGFYIGIDAHDGSVDRKAILANGDGSYSVATKSTRFAFCKTAHPAAVVLDNARIVDGQLVGEDAKARCNDTEEMSSRPSGTYAQVGVPGIMVLKIGPAERPLIHLHRISDN